MIGMEIGFEKSMARWWRPSVHSGWAYADFLCTENKLATVTKWPPKGRPGSFCDLYSVDFIKMRYLRFMKAVVCAPSRSGNLRSET